MKGLFLRDIAAWHAHCPTRIGRLERTFLEIRDANLATFKATCEFELPGIKLMMTTDSNALWTAEKSFKGYSERFSAPNFRSVPDPARSTATTLLAHRGAWVCEDDASCGGVWVGQAGPCIVQAVAVWRHPPDDEIIREAVAEWEATLPVTP